MDGAEDGDLPNTELVTKLGIQVLAGQQERKNSNSGELASIGDP